MSDKDVAAAFISAAEVKEEAERGAGGECETVCERELQFCGCRIHLTAERERGDRTLYI